MNNSSLARDTSFFCVTAKRQVFANSDHLGRVVCPACGEQVKPVVIKESR